MEGFFDSVAVRIAGSLVAALVAVALYYSFDIYQFFVRKDFGNVNAYLVHFTRTDKDSKDNRLVFELIGYKIPLRDICRNRFLFWLIIYRSTKVTVEQPVLYFGKASQQVLSSVRGRLSQIWASMVLKRAAGFSFKEIPCQIALIYDRSEDSRNFVIRVVLIRDSDIAAFEEYKKRPPMNTDNFLLAQRIVDAVEARRMRRVWPSSPRGGHLLFLKFIVFYMKSFPQ